MDEHESRERAWIGVGVLSLACALVFNELVLATLLSPDGSFEGSTRAAIRSAQCALFGVGLAVIAGRVRLAGLLGRCTCGPRALRTILAVGIVLRLAVFAFQFPANNDPHWDFIRFIVEHGRTPIADEVTLGFQPPLYYVLAAPFAIGESMKATQVLSLVLSIANLGLIHRIVRDTRLLSSAGARCHALLFAAVLPQFVLFSGFVSNDALAFPLGTLLATLTFAYIDAPSRKRLYVLGVVQGLALATKGTLIGFAPVIALVIAIVEWRRHRALVPIVTAGLAFGVTAILVGCYKFVENQVHFGTPVVGNDVLKQEWVEAQTGTYVGPSSLVDANVFKLSRYPFVGEETRHSIPLLLYGTFWTGYIKESNFVATRRHPFKLVVRVLYLAAIVPTLVILVGIGTRLRRAGHLARSALAPADDGERDLRVRSDLAALAALGFLALTTALVVKWGLKHDAWSFFQARLVFPAFLAIALAFGWGVEACERRGKLLLYLTNAALACAYLVIATYWAIELGDQCF